MRAFTGEDIANAGGTAYEADHAPDRSIEFPHCLMNPLDRPPVDFLGIGAQKAGTTWLWAMLRRHPGIWMPPRKELHYFDRALSYPSPSFLAGDRPLERFLGNEPHHLEFRAKCRGQLRRAWRERDWPALRWALRFYFGTINDNWYLSLFAAGGRAKRGEITPAYSILNAPDVERIRRLLPQLKIIFLLRDPIERAWSQVRFDWSRGAFDSISDFASIKSHIDSPTQMLRSDYLRTLEVWEANFPREQIFIGFYDDITLQPARLLADVLNFLGVDLEAVPPPEHLGEKVHISREKEMPEELKSYLREKYRPALRELSERFGGHAKRWLENAAAVA